jgi:hypothetical protein
LETVGIEEVLDDAVCCCGVVMEIYSMSCVRVDISLEVRRVGKRFGDAGRDAGERWVSGCEARSTCKEISMEKKKVVREIRATVNHIFFSSQDEGWTSKRSGGRSTITESEDLSEGNRLLGALSKESGANIEVARVEEGINVGWKNELAWITVSHLAGLTSQIAPGKVSCRKVLGDRGDSGIPSVDNVTELSGSDLLPDIRGREVDTNSTESRLEDRDQALAEPSSVGLAT